MSYGLVLPPMSAYSNADDVRPQIYGYTEKQTNLVDWYPFIVPYQAGDGWLLYNPWYYGEHLVYDWQISYADHVHGWSCAADRVVRGGNGFRKSGSRRYVLEAGARSPCP
jgi:hypothetical protein